MVTQIITLEDIKKQSVEEIFQQVAQGRTHFVVQMLDGEEIVIESKPRLKPLPVLEGYIPEGWKDAINGVDFLANDKRASQTRTRPGPSTHRPIAPLSCPGRHRRWA
jgi:hypothetical protein